MSGRLISATFAHTLLENLPGAAPSPAVVARALEAWTERCDLSLGPASSVRAICDVCVMPLLRLLGYTAVPGADGAGYAVMCVSSDTSVSLPIVVLPWGEPLDRAWRMAVAAGVGADARWCFGCNGTALRIVDAQRTWSRDYLEFDLAVCPHDDMARTLLWTLARAESFGLRPPLLDRAVDLSARHGIAVCRALGTGVLDALRALFGSLSVARRAPAAPVVFELSLTLLYRVLFLLFAEARGLVPMWHPVYRDRYTIDAIVGALVEGRRCRGIWDAVLAISRLAHAGCRAGELEVTAFNGRLFGAADAGSLERLRVPDEIMGRAVLDVATTVTGGRRLRIAYRDLDVEQLGAVYEHVLDYEPAGGGRPVLEQTRDTRKSSGTFYTPRGVTAHLVGQTLEPLVRGRSAEEILALRVLDPAMGSGAFLVGACRYLAAAVEGALVREGRWHAGDITAADRASVRREVAQRCLYGVDSNPTAVQLARLALWLATLAAEKPLSFLDHHLVAGDSLIGAAPEDLQRQPTGGVRPTRRADALPLFDGTDVTSVLRHAVRARVELSNQPDEDAAIVRAKERTLAGLHGRESPLGRWSQALDLWCAGWFWQDGAPPTPGIFAELRDRILRGRSSLPDPTTAKLLGHVASLGERHRFLHWRLAFPEVFCDGAGEPLASAGFDAVIGNPPWDMIRGDSGHDAARAVRRDEARRLTGFARESGIYRVETRAHANRYQLFVERALQVTRPGGRVGLVLPSGVATDAGSGPLRRHLFDRAEVDEVTGLTNRDGIFPIHRSVRFVLLTATVGGQTRQVACRFGLRGPDELDAPSRRTPTVLTRRFLARLSGEDDLGIPELQSDADLRIVEGIAARHPWLGAPDGWHVEFGRELNASDDRAVLSPYTGARGTCPVLEGKQVAPFRVAMTTCRYELRGDAARSRAPRRPRLAYRDVASATNRLTLIAALVPGGAVTTHTLFCLRTALPTDAQHVLCGLLNSLVANYLVRLRVNTHVTVSLVSRLPVPRLERDDPRFTRLAALARALHSGRTPAEDMPAYAELQADVARLYGLSRTALEHVLSTFPLVPSATKTRILAEWAG